MARKRFVDDGDVPSADVTSMERAAGHEREAERIEEADVDRSSLDEIRFDICINDKRLFVAALRLHTLIRVVQAGQPAREGEGGNRRLGSETALQRLECL